MKNIRICLIRMLCAVFLFMCHTGGSVCRSVCEKSLLTE